MQTTCHIYASPRQIADISECYFYHTIELPGYGLMVGEWDLREGVDAYLGNVHLAGKRVLEVGTANGFLCFEMERRGADVVAYDLSAEDDWDIVPYGGRVPDDVVRNRGIHIERINNAWWFTRGLVNSNARAVYGTAYNIPKDIGPVHISTFGSVLLHLRDPFLALQRAGEITTETMIVTDVRTQLSPRQSAFVALMPKWVRQRFIDCFIPHLTFLPSPTTKQPWETWWRLTPNLVSRFLEILGFPDTHISYHDQSCRGIRRGLFTVVGNRAKSS